MPTAPAVQRPSSSAVNLARQQTRRGRWLKTLLRWHWISSAIALCGMLVFAFTGITLNHAGAIEGKARIEQRQAMLPAALQSQLQRAAPDGEAPLPSALRDWLRDALQLRIGQIPAEWTPEEIYLALPRPGGDAWLRIDLDSREVEYELTRRGWIAWLNDLHKGRHTGAVWQAFIDLFALACVLFSLTGLLILQQHAAQRTLVWPLVALGALIPAVLILLFLP